MPRAERTAGYQPAEDRIVFTLTDNGDGTFSFDLDDQIDHEGNGDLETLSLDLTAAFSATDADGDEVALPDASVRVVVENDVPAPKTDPEPVSVTVYEDALGQGVAETPADGSTGNLDNDGNGTADVLATADEVTINAASLAGLVDPGADEPVEITLTSFGDDTTTVEDTSGNPITSKGDSVYYHAISASVVIGFAESGANAGYQPAEDRIVFTLTDNGDGTFSFDLDDQIDHEGNGDLETLALDLTAAFSATDADGDEVALPTHRSGWWWRTTFRRRRRIRNRCR